MEGSLWPHLLCVLAIHAVAVVDGNFDLIKHQSDVDTVRQLANIVGFSSSSNIPQLYPWNGIPGWSNFSQQLGVFVRFTTFELQLTWKEKLQ